MINFWIIIKDIKDYDTFWASKLQGLPAKKLGLKIRSQEEP